MKLLKTWFFSILLLAALGVPALAQSSNVSAQQFTVTPSSPVPVVSQVNISPSMPGTASYDYWIVTHLGGGVSAPAGPFAVNNAPATLSATAYNALNWTAISAGASYDVLRTTSTVIPSGACGCAVATGLTQASISDISSSLSAYTVQETTGSFSLSSGTLSGLPAIITSFGNSQLTYIKSDGTLGPLKLTDSGGQVFNVKAYGAKVDGVTDDATADQAAITAAEVSGGTVVFPPGVSLIASGLTISSPNVTLDMSGSALKYTGTSHALSILNTKHFTAQYLHIDLSSASPGADGIYIAGLWHATFYHPWVTLGSGTSGFNILTSETGGNNWGSYDINLIDPYTDGSGVQAVVTGQTSGDTVNVTHLNIWGGWFDSGGTNELVFNHISDLQIIGSAIGTGPGISGDLVTLANVSDSVLMPGESGVATGYCFNWGSGNSADTLLLPSNANSCTAGFQNTSTYSPQMFEQGYAKLFASGSDQTYYAELQSNYTYANSFNLIVNGGDGPFNLLQYGNPSGLTLSTNSALPITLSPSLGGNVILNPTGAGIAEVGSQKITVAGANGISAGTVTLAAGAGSHTFSTAYSATPVCTATDQTSAAAVKATSSTTAVTLTGTGTDIINWICTPAAN